MNLKMQNIILIGLFFVCAFLIPSSSAQEKQASEFENLKIFDPNIQRPELIDKMKSFTQALGVRCTFCHIREDSGGRSQFNFASDSLEHKKMAREMIIMTADINKTHLAKLAEESSGKKPEVSCFTCHHGHKEPVKLNDELINAVEQNGIDSAVALYHSLKEMYYGHAVYDFSKDVLNMTAVSLGEAGKIDEAVAMLKLNEQVYPDHTETKEFYVMLYVGVGMIDEAIEACKNVLEVNPDNGRIKRTLEQLQKSQENTNGG